MAKHLIEPFAKKSGQPQSKVEKLFKEVKKKIDIAIEKKDLTFEKNSTTYWAYIIQAVKDELGIGEETDAGAIDKIIIGRISESLNT